MLTSYHENDNCFTEQKNCDAIRKTVGCFRFDTPAGREALAEVYKYMWPLYNYWYPLFRLFDKEMRGNGRYRKIYEKRAKTPCRRLFESARVPEESKAELRRRKKQG